MTADAELTALEQTLRAFAEFMAGYRMHPDTLPTVREQLILLLWQTARATRQYSGSLGAFRRRFGEFWVELGVAEQVKRRTVVLEATQ
jgi:hypothetical protein